jgi:hypothetical protein
MILLPKRSERLEKRNIYQQKYSLIFQDTYRIPRKYYMSSKAYEIMDVMLKKKIKKIKTNYF